MKVAIYIRTIKSAQGTERVTANIAMGLADRGHDVDFLVEDHTGWLIEKLASHPRITVINLGDQRGSVLLHRGLQLWIILKNILSSPLSLIGIGDACSARLIRLMGHNDPPVLSLYRYLKRSRPLSVMSFLNQSNLVLLLTAPLVPGPTRFIVNVRNHITTSAKQGKSRWMRSVPRLMKRFFPRADLILAPSQGVAEDVRNITGIAPDKFRVVYNPVYRPEITELSREALSHPWLADTDIPVIIAAGKLKPQKDFETLLRAFALVRSRREARLMILGRGPRQQALLELAEQLGVKDDFQLPGHVKNPYAYFGRAAVFVLSSAWEGLPNVLIEAMACGCPVVSTDCPSGPFEILDEGRVGKLVPVGNSEQMALAIAQTIDSPPMAEMMIERAGVFSYENSIACYEAVLGGNRSADPGQPHDPGA
jgi:glycosyltransferase involved in cell wall biosynthesis